ncbi:hypothetical protein [Hahella sp. NBU794]|uniref:hypothetical protein n=1 Tax=Hahella sp. NBU794 TaxID=3422590 RepID=UPI003D6DDC79
MSKEKGFKSSKPVQDFHKPSEAIAYAISMVEKDMAFAIKSVTRSSANKSDKSTK